MLSTIVLLVDDEVPFVEAMERRLAKGGLDGVQYKKVTQIKQPSASPRLYCY